MEQIVKCFLIGVLLFVLYSLCSSSKNNNYNNYNEIEYYDNYNGEEMNRMNRINNKESKQTQKKPNFLFIWGDDIGISNISAYSLGIMGFKTKNIDSIAKDGVLFTDYYGQQSCTAGRAAFITGQCPFRTGLLKVGLPGTPIGLSKKDITIASALKNYGYKTGHFGKNHLGDQDQHLPTKHGFDEFFGNLYHLNAEEEPEDEDYPKDPEFRKKYAPRGVLHTYSDGRMENTGPLTKKRMETIDDEICDASEKFIRDSVKEDKPFFVWLNLTHMHIWTRLQESQKGKTNYGLYADGMNVVDTQVGHFLNLLKELGIEDNTCVVFSTDNGAEIMAWPDGGMTPFRGEKATPYEGGFRVPCVVKWPQYIQKNQISNEIMAHEDWFPTIMKAVDPNFDIVEELKKGYTFDGREYKNHLDGYNQLELFKGGKSNRESFFYFMDDGTLGAIRVSDWKAIYIDHKAEKLNIWTEPYRTLRMPHIVNLRSDPYERAEKESFGYDEWMINKSYLFIPAQEYIQKFLATFKKFPPRQKSSTLNIKDLTDKLLPNTYNQ
jgi:arylsulfatase